LARITKPEPARAENDRLGTQVLESAVRAVRPDDEHPGCRVHRGDDAQLRRRPADPVERLVRDLTLDERDVELPGLEERDVLGAALGVALLDRERRLVSWTVSATAAP